MLFNIKDNVGISINKSRINVELELEEDSEKEGNSTLSFKEWC